MLRALVLSAALLATPALAAPLTAADIRALPRVSAQPEHFVPQGWVIEHTATGDLNGDGKADQALTLVEAPPANVDPDNPPERERALLVLIRNDVGYGRAAGNGALLQCTRCGGAFYGVNETPVDVTIAKGVLIVRQDYGSRNVVATTHRFRRDPASGAFRLIGYDHEDTDRATGLRIVESTNYLTGVKLTEAFQYDADTDKETRQSLNRARVPRLAPDLDTIGPRAGLE